MQTNPFFPEIRGNFGFGCMRLPMDGDKIDYAYFSRMADAFLDAGFNYFDTAHGYHGGLSETAIRDCVAKRHDRSRFVLTNKLSSGFFDTHEQIRPFFEQQLEACGVEYFDFYLMHAQNTRYYEKYTRCKAYETAYGFKQEGLIRHFGISFHDKAEVLEKVLTAHPDMEFVQLQINYADWENPSVTARANYEVARKYGKKIVVMEPVKGGRLAKPPAEALKLFKEYAPERSAASWAIRFVASLEGILTVLSGMSNTAQMLDNLSYMRDFQPLNAEERAIIKKAQDILGRSSGIPCTSCSYCTKGCPKQVPIPEIFAAMNLSLSHGQMQEAKDEYAKILERGAGADACIACGQCENVCPQHIGIIAKLKDCAEALK